MYSYVSVVPTTGKAGAQVRVRVHEISLSLRSQSGRSRVWSDEVQPLIASMAGRADADWDWRYRLPGMLLFAGGHRRARIFQLSVTADERPAAMIAILDRERWPRNRRLQATFVWYLSTAPSRYLEIVSPDGSTVVPKRIGRVALDIATTISLNGRSEGRLWLHADPAGGDSLLKWYEDIGMSRIDETAHRYLPGFGDMGRPNDGRYLCVDTTEALAMHEELQGYRLG